LLPVGVDQLDYAILWNAARSSVAVPFR
jgi:hypothetical protein